MAPDCILLFIFSPFHAFLPLHLFSTPFVLRHIPAFLLEFSLEWPLFLFSMQLPKSLSSLTPLHMGLQLKLPSAAVDVTVFHILLPVNHTGSTHPCYSSVKSWCFSSFCCCQFYVLFKACIPFLQVAYEKAITEHMLKTILIDIQDSGVGGNALDLYQCRELSYTNLPVRKHH